MTLTFDRSTPKSWNF